MYLQEVMRSTQSMEQKYHQLSDYVLLDYGYRAIMCVPAHDDRDFEFAKKFNIPIIQVIAKDGKEIENMEEAYTEASGIMINSGDWNGKESSELKEEAPKIIEEMGIGKKTTNYKLRDWVFSRQRYLGEPIYCSLSRLWSSSGTRRRIAINITRSREIRTNRNRRISISRYRRMGETASVLYVAKMPNVRQIQCLSGLDLHGIS